MKSCPHVLVQGYEELRGSGDNAPCILNLGYRWKRVASLVLRLLYIPTHIRWEAE